MKIEYQNRDQVRSQLTIAGYNFEQVTELSHF